ncbi:MAG TPA: Ig-like domain repeat protein, partial [Terriglobales bacterium]|nr:Ig-like domain repeat protein [Terriglobales bacterium]
MSSCRNCYCARIVLLAITLGTVVGARIARGEQNQPALQLTSPADGTVVAPGQPLSLTVVAISNARFVEVSVISPLGGSSIANSLPAQLSMTVPADVALRQYGLTATGGTSDGQVLYSNQVTIDVERPDLPTSLRAEPDSIFFSGQSGDEPLAVYGIFSDGSHPEVTQSSKVTFASSNPAIATVDGNGTVKPVSQGTATITATYSQAGNNVSVAVPVKVPKPTLSASPHALNFGSQNVGMTSAPQSVTLTNVSNEQQLRVHASRLFGNFAEMDNCAPSSPLGVGAECMVNVVFAPTSAGVQNGVLFISNSQDGESTEIALSGTGIGQPTTNTTLTSSANPSVYGQATTLSSGVNASSGTGTPTGSVTFDDGTNALGTASLSDAQATFTVSSLNVGSHSISAAYSGDSNFLASTSSALSQVVNQASTSTALTSSASSPILNTSITLTANLSVIAPGAGTPTGTITFQEGSNVLATSPVGSSGQATFSTASLAVGAHSLVASYSGDANFQPSNGTISQQIAYGVCVLYDQTRSVNSGATFPIKLY